VWPRAGRSARPAGRDPSALRLRRPAAARRRLVRRGAAGRGGAGLFRGGQGRRRRPRDRHVVARLPRGRAAAGRAGGRGLCRRDQPGADPADAAWGRRRLLDLPAEDRPRERLVRHGAGALSNRELLAVILGTGTSKASALDVAEALLASGLRGLAARSVGELEAERGLGRAKAARVAATLELGARL